MIKTINGGEASEDDKDFMKIKFESDDDLSLGRILKLHMLTVIVRSVFEEDGKYPKKFQMTVCMSYKNATQYKANKH